MSWIPPLLVAIPLLTAALIVGGDHVAPTALQDALGLGAAAATCALAIVLLLDTEDHEIVHWFSGWHPRGGVALGIDFATGPLGAGLAALTSGVVLLVLLYSLRFRDAPSRLYDVLVLVCGGSMCGFALSGDLFNLFVWLELMSVAAYALTGLKIKQLGPLQGAINFAVVNTVGTYLLVVGIALTYARTGALNLAQIGETLSDRRPDGLVIVAFTLIVCGFLCKSGVVPFHFWVADAYAVAPAPICALFAAVMTDIGLFGVARVYWTAFDGALASNARAVGDLLLGLGIASSLLGGVMAFLQRHLKRMLAYSVVCHIGAMLAGIGLMSSKGLAGTADLLIAHAFLTAGLFLAAGILLIWLRSIDELRLHGRGRNRPWLGALWLAGAVGLAGPPYVGVYLGHAQIDDAAAALGRHWVQPLLWAAGALASAALLRAGARVFLGWGTGVDELLSQEADEQPPRQQGGVRMLGAIAAVTVCLGVVASVVPGLAARSEHAADRFRDRGAYAARVLHGEPVATAPHLPLSVARSSRESVLYGIGATALAVALAGAGLWRARVVRADAGPLAPALAGLRALHSGVIGDYVLWLVVGTATIGLVWAFTLR